MTQLVGTYEPFRIWYPYLLGDECTCATKIGLTSWTTGKYQLQLLFIVAAEFNFASPLLTAASPAASKLPATAWPLGATALEGHIYRAAHPCCALEQAAAAS